ncbi:hypothetical protein RJ639_015049 [Escallonia herrerae]|uniref:Reverse transcriptase Ty1/copia-type domain-containing protein n=1 Tax=Escallonia herrerae TaxID=1293975 RepID=A0AA89ANR9_9ASTE|nr:hypothetical protein RJ639_015049 [Escallonia herrerae]
MKGNGSGRRNQFPPCPQCGKTNHSQEYCFKVIGYPSDWRKPRKGNSSRADHKQTNSSNAAFTAKMDGENLLIPGLTPSQQQQLMALLNGQEAPGVSKLTRDLNCTLTFWQNFFVIQDLHSRRLIGVGRERNGLYYLEPIKGGKALMARNTISANMWHLRLGHLPKGYRIYDLESKKIYVSRDVQFLEGIYPYIKSNLGESRQVINEEPDAGNAPLSTDLCTDSVEEPVMESIATEPISPDIEVGCSESDESDPTVENQQVATLPSKRQRQVSRFLSGYQYVLPPSLAPVENNTPPSSHSANSTASRNWYKKFTAALLAIGFRQCTADYSLFTFTHGGSFVVVLVYVDDVIITGTDSDQICKLKNYLDTKFHIKNLGKLKYFLGIEVARSPAGIFLSQRKYVLDILAECGLSGCKPASFPMEQQHKLSNESVSWRAKKQTVVSRSSAEAEYRAMATTTSEIIWLKQLLQDLEVSCTTPVSLFCDNRAAIHIAANPTFSPKLWDMIDFISYLASWAFPLFMLQLEVEYWRIFYFHSDRLQKVEKYMSTIQKLSATMGMDSSMIITKVHPSLKKLSRLSKNISDSNLAKLNSIVESLEAEKQIRLEKVIFLLLLAPFRMLSQCQKLASRLAAMCKWKNNLVYNIGHYNQSANNSNYGNMK